jgi:hypothetical protein
VLAAALLAVSLIVLALAPAAGASTRIDDRQLKKSSGKKGWTKVSFRKAYKGTLSRTQKAKATAATKVAASNGGSVTFQAGPGRGKFVVTVGKKKKTVNTSGKAVKLKTVSFRGAGKVKLKVTKPGPNGVYIDAVALTKAPVATAPALNAPPASACAAGTSDGGTLVTAPGTPLRICQLPGRVAANMVLQKIPQVAYSLSGPVEVGGDVGGDGTLVGGNAVTLTVEAGVVVIADDPTDALFVNRGSRISAIGSAAQPIVFTSRSNLTGAATEASAGLWGGITLLGRGPISDCDIAAPGGAVNCQNTVPNFTAKYGGALLTDSSGTMSHVQIRFAGGSVSAGIEGVGLRVAAAGNKTTLDHIQVLASGGDGLSVYGGRANFSNLALAGAADDVLDTDFGYRGTIQFLVGVQSGPGSGDALVEIDSNGNEDALPRQYARIANATLIGRSTVQNRNMLLVRGGTDLALLNSVVTGTLNCLDIDETGGTTTRAADSGLQDLGAPIFRSVGLACPNPYTNDGNVTTATVSTIFGSGTNNNNSAHVPSFTGFVNGPNESAIAATDPTAFNADVYGSPNPSSPNRLVATTYVGAIQNAADTRFRGWTCDTGFANFGSGVSCLASPL